MVFNIKRIHKLTALTLISLFALTSCGGTTKPSTDNELNVYTSFSAMTALTMPLVTDETTVIQLTEPNVEAHDFEPSGRDIARVSEAKLFIYNGLGIEHYVEDLKNSVDGDTLFVDTTNNAPFVLEDDAHTWLSFIHVKSQVKNITHGLVSVDNPNADLYVANEGEFLSELEQLDDKYTLYLNTKKGQSVVVLHPAYSYLFDPYDIEQISIQINHDVEPTIAELKSVIDYINTNNVKYIIAPSQEVTKPLQTVLDETEAEVVVIDNLENITDEITKDTYISIMSENLDVIKTVLN